MEKKKREILSRACFDKYRNSRKQVISIHGFYKDQSLTNEFKSTQYILIPVQSHLIDKSYEKCFPLMSTCLASDPRTRGRGAYLTYQSRPGLQLLPASLCPYLIYPAPNLELSSLGAWAVLPPETLPYIIHTFCTTLAGCALFLPPPLFLPPHGCKSAHVYFGLFTSGEITYY